MKLLKRVLLGFAFLLLVSLVAIIWYLKIDSDKKIANRPKPCDPLVKVDGFTTVKTVDGGITLKLPFYAGYWRSRERGCDIAEGMSIDYLWHERKLIPKSINSAKLSEDKYMPRVRIYYRYAWAKPEDMDALSKRFKKEDWHYTPAIPHKRFPLEFYPRFLWDDPENPSETALKRATLDHYWGIRDTKYRNVRDGKPFVAYCNIPAKDPKDSNSRVESDFAQFGDSKCRGSLNATKNGKGLSFMIDVWAYLGSDQLGVSEINLIYDAVVEELQSFIQE